MEVLAMNNLKQQADEIISQATKYKDLNKLVDLLIKEKETVLIEFLKQLKKHKKTDLYNYLSAYYKQKKDR